MSAHILSGACIDPAALDDLMPDWKARGAPLDTEVTQDRFYFLSAAGSVRIPHFIMPPLMSNRGCYIASLGLVCRWLAKEAEALGVEIYPGFAAVDVTRGPGARSRASSPATWVPRATDTTRKAMRRVWSYGRSTP